MTGEALKPILQRGKKMRKTNLLIRTGAALLAGATLFLAVPVTAEAKEYGYTYNYDYWEDVQESPDFYSVCKVFTYTDLGLDKKLNAPQGIFVLDNEIYLCDTGNNRIIQLHRDSAEKLEVVRILEEFNGANGKESFNKPTDVAVTSFSSPIRAVQES